MTQRLMKSTDNPDPGGSWGPDPDASRALDPIDRAKTARVGLRVFLCVVSSFFFLFLIAFIARSQLPDWEALTDPLAPLNNPSQLWLNTGALLLASIALQWSRMAARRNQLNATLIGFALGGVFAITFLVGQLWVWRLFSAAGYYLASNPANSFFYLLTGLHGLHLLGGLVAWSRIAARLLAGQPLSRLKTGVELCAIYWHFLLALWAVLFAVLTSTPATYQAIAAFCGLR